MASLGAKISVYKRFLHRPALSCSCKVPKRRETWCAARSFSRATWGENSFEEEAVMYPHASRWLWWWAPPPRCCTLLLGGGRRSTQTHLQWCITRLSWRWGSCGRSGTIKWTMSNRHWSELTAQCTPSWGILPISCHLCTSKPLSFPLKMLTFLIHCCGRNFFAF